MMLKAIAVLAAFSSAAAAINLHLAPEDVDRALAMGRRSEAQAARIHAPYIRQLDVTVDTTTVRQVEVVTPFRRVVLFAEQRRQVGDYTVSRADVETEVGAWRTRVSLVATVRFHPQNVLTSVPPIETFVRDPVLGSDVPPLDVTRKALTATGTSRPILGATIETIFDAGLLANLNASVVVALRGTELARTTIDFRSIE